MYKIGLILLLSLASAHAFWSACADRPGAAPPTRVESAACSGDICILQRGEMLRASSFTVVTSVHHRLDVRVTAYILGIGIILPQDPPHDDACNSLFIDGVFTGCPTTPGAETEYRIEFLIPETYPSFSNTRVRFDLMEDGVYVACSDIMATLL